MDVITKIRRKLGFFLRESGPFGPRFYESGGVLRVSPRVKLGGRSASDDAIPSVTTAQVDMPSRPAPDTSIRDLHGLGSDIWADTDADGYVRDLRA